MRYLLLALVLVAGPAWAAKPGAAEAAPATRLGPSFPCPAPRDPLGQMICSDDGLARADLAFVQAYQALRQQGGVAGQKALAAESVAFGQAVRRECGIGTATAAGGTGCVAAAYARQRDTWLKRLTGPAAEEARRPLEAQVALQRALQGMGLLPANAVIDGVYGPDTRTAIAALETRAGLPVTGLMGTGKRRR